MSSKTKPKDYVPFLIAWPAAVVGLYKILRELELKPAQLTAAEKLEFFLAVFTMSRVVSKDKITAILRVHWMKSLDDDAPPLTGDEQEPEGEGVHRAIGDLLSCTRCLGVWNSLFLYALLSLRPELGKIVMHTFAASGANFYLQAEFERLAAKANKATKNGRE